MARPRIYSHGGYDWTDRYPAIASAAGKLRAKPFTIDGEAVVTGLDGIALFDALHRRRRWQSTQTKTATVFEHACRFGFEGIVSKRLSAPYRSGPSRDWIKTNNPNSPAMVRAQEGRW
jgi:bifunctional non-homologous end joining protein LigD